MVYYEEGGTSFLFDSKLYCLTRRDDVSEKYGPKSFCNSSSTGGGGNLTCPWYGVVPFFRVLFYDRFRIHGHGLQQLFAFSGFMGIVFCKNSFICEMFWHFRIYRYAFQKIFRIHGYAFEKFPQIYGWYFTI